MKYPNNLSIHLAAAALGLAAFTACGVEPTPTTRVVDGVFIELADGASDDTVLADALSLAQDTRRDLEAFEPEAGHRIEIEYLGKASFTQQAPEPPAEPADVAPPAPDAMSSMDGVNLATGNQFRVRLSYDLLAAIGAHDQAHGADLGTPAEESAEPVFVPEGLDPELVAGASLSNADDDRYRPYGRNATVTNAVHRRIVNMGGCTGTLVGPRHVVTAGHCLYNRRTSSWSNGYNVDVGRNGTALRASVRVDRNNVPSGQVVWLFTPSQFRTASNTSGYDFGVLTIPARLGDDVGWMGRVSYNASSLANANVYRRGYPMCTSTIRIGGVNVARVDEPCSDDGAAGEQSCTCREDHLYANAGFCSINEYDNQDSNNWNRTFYHSCDASAADSGSPLYLYHQGTASVTAVHYLSSCERIAESHPSHIECTGTRINRPLRATRLTPEWRDWIGYFRNRFP